MRHLRVSLMGRCRILSDGQYLEEPLPTKALELCCYLLMYRKRPHCRRTLAALLWPESSDAQALKYLRQALWQIQATLDADIQEESKFLLTDLDWIQVNPGIDLWLDVEELELASSLTHDRFGSDLSEHDAEVALGAVALCKGDLLEGWYTDWCIYERERIENLYLALLDKLMNYCASRHDYLRGVQFGTRILRHDRAHERTHQALMRLHSLAGDRTRALRQYDECVAALSEELGVEPSPATMLLRQQIAGGVSVAARAVASGDQLDVTEAQDLLNGMLAELRRIVSVATELQAQLGSRLQPSQ